MKCEKCGAEIGKDKVFCSLCGKEVQLVPDYNFLDEDFLSGMVQNGGKTVLESKSCNNRKISESQVKAEKKSSRILVVAVGTILGLLIICIAIFFMKQNIETTHYNSYDYQIQQGKKFLSEGEDTNAIAAYQRALELHPKDMTARKALLDIYISQKDDTSAILILEELIAENPSDAESYQQLIAIYDKHKQYEEIQKLCDDLQDSDLLDLFADYLVERPKFSNISGTYAKPLDIQLTSAHGYDIYYTTDGKDPISQGQLYEKPIPLKEETTTSILAVTKNQKGIYSEIVENIYTIQYEPPDSPKVTPIGGNYVEPQSIVIEVPAHCTLYYTWDGTEPTTASAIYSSPLEMPQGNHVLSVIAVDAAGRKSDVYRVNYIYMP